MISLTPSETQRYDRQIKIAGFGPEGQQRLKSARVLLCGLGGLGSIIAGYLAAVGVGHLRIAEKDSLEISNLNRQILYTTDDLDQPKAITGGRRLARLNPYCQLEALRAEVKRENAAELARGCDLILDGSDNFHSRKILGRASLELGIPFVFGGVLEYGGMLSAFVPGKTACFECMFGYDDFPLDRPGVLGPLPGMVGFMQALEAIKLLAHHQTSLAGRLLLIDGKKLSFRSVATSPNPNCPACAGHGEP